MRHRRAELFGVICLIVFVALFFGVMAAIELVTYGECREHGFTSLYCLFHR